MAILQISQIKHRRGLNTDLPQLGSAELGWSIDTRQLYIGNVTLAEGAPEIGNTEILTEYSNIPGVTGYSQILQNDTANANVVSMLFDTSNPGVSLNYHLIRDSNVRVGTLRISQYLTNLSWDEEYTETANVGVRFTCITVDSQYTQVQATTSNLGSNATLRYTINSITI